MLSIPTNARALAELAASYKAPPTTKMLTALRTVRITSQPLCYKPYQILWYAAARLHGNGITLHYSAALQELLREFQSSVTFIEE
jgi:hypothetical protein